MRRLAAFALVLGVSLVSWRCSVACGCEPPPIDFGLPYTLADTPPPALVASDTLAATVAYSGGCAVHRFEARSVGVDGRRQVYALRHATDRPDACEAHITDRVRVPLRNRDASRPGLVLTRPSGADLVVVP